MGSERRDEGAKRLELIHLNAISQIHLNSSFLKEDGANKAVSPTKEMLN
jgi:hypothetical protein